jgi:hypothetical protein
MSDLSYSFGSKSVTVEISYGLLLRWLLKFAALVVLATSLFALTSDMVLPCEALGGKLGRACEAIR